jgi:Ca-activated chloride channel homolog
MRISHWVWLLPLVSNPGAAGSPPGWIQANGPILANARVDARISTNSELVLIPVSVVDRHDRFVQDLPPGRFRLFENKQEQRLSHFTMEEAPVSAAIVLDVSNSMRNALPLARTGALLMLEAANPADEICLVTFRDGPRVEVGFGADRGRIDAAVSQTAPSGGTALLDALVLAVHHLRREGRLRRRAIVVFSDGGERDSRYRWKDVRDIVREGDARIYVFALAGAPDPESSEQDRSCRMELRNMSRETGGRYFDIDNRQRLLDAIGKLDIHSSYLLAYYPSNRDSGGLYRRVEVRLATGPDDLKLFWKRGYFAPR